MYFDDDRLRMLEARLSNLTPEFVNILKEYLKYYRYLTVVASIKEDKKDGDLVKREGLLLGIENLYKVLDSVEKKTSYTNAFTGKEEYVGVKKEEYKEI